MTPAESISPTQNNFDEIAGSGPDLVEWSECAARIVDCEDDADALADAILRALDALSPTRLSFVSIYSGRRWEPDYFWRHPVELEVPATYYSPQLQRLDPFATAVRDGQSGVLKLWDIAPPGFLESEIYRRHFLDFGETDEVRHVKPRGRGYFIEAGVGAAEHFTEEILARHNAAHPLIAAALRRLESILNVGVEHDDETTEDHLEIDSALHHFGRDVLTEREHEVVHLILRGHNTESVAHQLGISWNTARRHRRRVYVKLGVTSQGELFYEFLRSLGLDPGAA